MQNRILLMNDLPGIGRAALNMMLPILTQMGAEPVCLPTALFSNTLNFGEAAILDTTEYLEQAAEKWKELGTGFDGVMTGFILHERQAEWIADFCKKQREQGAVIFCDPILGDHGRLYRGITQSRVECMKRIVRESRYVLPNYTEACYLTGRPYCPDPCEREIHSVLQDLTDLGARAVILKSVYGEGHYRVYGFDAETGQQFTCPYEALPVNYSGTGDAFAALFAGKLLAGEKLEHSVRYAVDTVRAMIERNVRLGHTGFLYEPCLDLV